jgi:hypothetical protein
MCRPRMGECWVVIEEEVAVESAGGLDRVEVVCPALVETAASMITVLVDGAVRPALSVAV